MALNLVYDWTSTLGLVFGGCCSNAITLEQLTSNYPSAGSLITFFQFALISIRGIPKFVVWTRYGPRFKPRRIPLTPYLVQVGLFYLVSLLNNAAFGYEIPMSVHIIFRSGGLVVSMVMGWFSGKKYNLTQALAVIFVTIGVILTTFSATPSASRSGFNATSTAGDSWNYATGIAILSLALVFSGFLGLAQDWTYTKYGRPQSSSASKTNSPGQASAASSQPPQWQESLFYLHFLSLPMFVFVRQDIQAQVNLISNGPRTAWVAPIPLPESLITLLPTALSPHFAFTKAPMQSNTLNVSLYIPSGFIPLLLNTITQVLCASGVHRLTTRVSSLTVTLILVVRKAVSLLLSVLGAGIIPGVGGGKARAVDHTLMWSGAAFVLVGTVLYSLGTGGKKGVVSTNRKDKKE